MRYVFLMSIPLGISLETAQWHKRHSFEMAVLYADQGNHMRSSLSLSRYFYWESVINDNV